mmetsp:Transcript_7412/g.19777  ORF Transcript_7412/g.19777 Transcript_7412/m.19777 type:complete len:291 (+) Transcript_7412:2060-2932(+)
MVSILPLSPDISNSTLRVGLVQEDPRVGLIELARPQRANAFDGGMFDLFPRAVAALSETSGVQCLLICAQGEGPFCSGIDTSYLKGMLDQMRAIEARGCPGRAREYLRSHVLGLQESFSSLEKCRWPVIVAIHGACIGGGVDLAAAADIRVCSQKATFSVKEVDLAITADLGSLQRLPHLIGHGATADLALTARTISSAEALSLGLVTQVIGDDNATLTAGALKLAKSLASKSPLAMVGTKRTLLHKRDSANSVASELEYIATHNAAMLVSEDLERTMRTRGKAVTFSKL